MLAVQFPDEIDRRLEAVAKARGRSKEDCVREAVAEYLADLEDLATAERRLADIRAGRAGTVSLDQAARDLDLGD